MLCVLPQALTESIVWLELAGVYSEANKFADATFCLSKAGAHADLPLFWNVLGTSLVASEVPTGQSIPLQHLEHARLKILPALEPSLLHCVVAGALEHAKGNTIPAIQALSRAVSLGATDNSARVKLAEALLLGEGSRDVAVAKFHLQEALAQDPKDHHAWFYMGVACQSMGEVEEGARCFQRSQALRVSAPACPFSIVQPTILSSKSA